VQKCFLLSFFFSKPKKKKKKKKKKGCKNVYQSFDKYTETERLTGDNQYRAEGHGLQDAEKGCRFIQFPPVLHLQLKRFDFDLESMRNYKIHSRYEFPRELDLSKYVDANSPFRNDPALYVLQGVMVHSGTAGGGHYYAYFRPSARKRWYKFNDTKVTRATSEEAVEGNFGSGSSTGASARGGGGGGGMMLSMLGGGGGVDSYTSAYMLQYVRKDHFEACVAAVPIDVVPAHISLRFQEEEKERERKKQEKQDAEKYTIVKVFDEADLAAHSHFDLMDFDRVRPDRVFRVLNEWTISQLKVCQNTKSAFFFFLKKKKKKKKKKKTDQESHLVQAFGVDSADRLQVRLFTRRRNMTVRASRLVDNDKGSISSFKNKDNSDNVKLLIEISKRTVAPFFDPPSDDECQIFFKFYNPVTRHLSYAGRFKMNKQQAPILVEPQLRAFAGVGPNEPLQYYEEVRTDTVRIDPMDPSKSLEALDLGNGDIVVFQTIAPPSVPPPAGCEVADAPYPTAPLYYTFLKESISIRFRRVVDFEKDPGFTVMCIRSHGYEQLQDLVAKHLPPGVCDNPRKIEFTGQSAFSGKPVWSGPFPVSSSPTVSKMLYAFDRVLDTIFYEVLPFPLDVMKSKMTLQTTAVDLRQTVLFTGRAYVDRTGTCLDLLNTIRGHCGAQIPSEQELRVLSVSNCKVHQILKEQEPLTALLSRAPELVVEFVSPEEKTLEKGDKLVQCVHAEFDGYLTAFGIPFMFAIHRKETIGSVRARLQARLHLSAEEIARWKLGVAESGYLSGFKPMADADHLSPHNWTSGSYLALVHTNSKRGASMHRQEGVVIREAQTK
jgi:ubiquitin carboxyl-terminal hydrolase 7